jgi:hypothetical protein
MRMTVVPHHDMARLADTHAAEIVGQRPDLPYAEDWRSTRYALRRG